MRNKIGLAMACFVFSGLLIGLASPAWAACTKPFFTGTDGVCLTSQPSNSCTGFPIHITTTGSYKLFSNLTVTCTGRDAIDVAASAGPLVTIDLNGFSIIGPGSGTGIGINSSATSLVVHNGGVASMGTGIVANDCKVEEVHVLFNASAGIECDDGVILNNTVAFNGGTGISTFDAVIQGNKVVNNAFGIGTFDSVTQGNKVFGNAFGGLSILFGIVENNKVAFNGFPNGGDGIDVGPATVTENNVVGNDGDGIGVFDDGTKVGENSVFDNGGDGIDVFARGANVLGNTAAGNTGFGLEFFDTTSGYTNNVMFGNNGSSVGACTGAGAQVSGGTSTGFVGGTNLCNGTLG